MSKSNVARIRVPDSIAPGEEPGSVDAECEAIAEFLETDPAAAYLRRNPVQRAAFWELITTPYNSADVQEACRRVAAVLLLLTNDEDEIIRTAFGSVAYDAGKGRGAVRS